MHSFPTSQSYFIHPRWMSILFWVYSSVIWSEVTETKSKTGHVLSGCIWHQVDYSSWALEMFANDHAAHLAFSEGVLLSALWMRLHSRWFLLGWMIFNLVNLGEVRNEIVTIREASCIPASQMDVKNISGMEFPATKSVSEPLVICCDRHW